MTTPKPGDEPVELLPCPFCGGEGDISFYTSAQSPDPKGRFVECSSCAAAGPSFEIQGEAPDKDEFTQSKAIAAWNTRIPMTESPKDTVMETDINRHTHFTPPDRQGLVDMVDRALQFAVACGLEDITDADAAAILAALRAQPVQEDGDFYAGRYAERCGDVLRLREALMRADRALMNAGMSDDARARVEIAAALNPEPSA